MIEDAKQVMRRLGQQVEASRKARSLIQADVSRRTGIDRGAIAKIENGQGNSTVEKLVAVGDAVGLSLVYVPTERLEEVLRLIGQPRVAADATAGAGGVLDDVLVTPDEEAPETSRGP